MSIASQQLSIKAADTIFGRFRDLFPDRRPRPEHVMTLSDDRIRAAGLGAWGLGLGAWGVAANAQSQVNSVSSFFYRCK